MLFNNLTKIKDLSVRFLPTKIPEAPPQAKLWEVKMTAPQNDPSGNTGQPVIVIGCLRAFRRNRFIAF